MTVPVFPFEEKLASPDGTDNMPRTSISFFGRESCACAVTNAKTTGPHGRPTEEFFAAYRPLYSRMQFGRTVSFNRIGPSIFSMGEETA